MRIISKLINKLGENVSVIASSDNNQNDKQAANNLNNNDTDIIIELSEENEQLREKIQELTA